MTVPQVFMFVDIGSTTIRARQDGTLDQVVAQTTARIQCYRADQQVHLDAFSDGLAVAVARGVNASLQINDPTLIVYVTNAVVSDNDKVVIDQHLRKLNPVTMMAWVVLPNMATQRPWLERLDYTAPKPGQTAIIYPGEDIATAFSFKVDLFFMSLR